MHWEDRIFILPSISKEHVWEMEIVTDEDAEFIESKDQVNMPGRSVAIFTAKKKKK